MNVKALLQLACVAVILFQAIVTYNPPGPGPGPGPDPKPPPVIIPDWPAPPADLQAAIAPVRTVMQSADRLKAAAWAGAWEEYLMTFMDRQPLASTGALKSEMQQEVLIEAAERLNLAGAFPGFSASLDSAFATYFGSEDVPLDWNKGKAFVSAVVWACK